MKTYEKPEIQVETFEVEDIITASSPVLPGDNWVGNNPND